MTAGEYLSSISTVSGVSALEHLQNVEVNVVAQYTEYGDKFAANLTDEALLANITEYKLTSNITEQELIANIENKHEASMLDQYTAILN